MKKFSNISNEKINDEPIKTEVKINEQDLFKTKVMNLMEQLLTIRSFGPIDRYYRAGNIKIVGKEMFLEALIDILNDKSYTDEKRILESLKSEINDWKLIDEKIDKVDKILNESENKKKLSNHISRLKYIYEVYGNDEELLMNIIEKNCNKIKNKSTAYLRAVTAEKMAFDDNKYPKDLFIKISDKFRKRSSQL